MLQDTWKTRLFRYAHLQAYGQPARQAALSQSSRTILGRTLRKRKDMTRSTQWIHKLQGEARPNELMARHTSLRVGGPADWYLLPAGLDDLRLILRHRENRPLFILGEGSNLLVSDKGIRGLVISLKRGFKQVGAPEFFQNDAGEACARLRAGAGVKMSYLVKYAARYGLAGMEDLVGVPGSLGGALVMNAGADGTEIGPLVHSLTVLTPEGELKTWDRGQLRFEYRRTVFPESGGIIVSAELVLKRGDRMAIQDRIDRHLKRRSQKQPLSLPNSGSVFKNPPGDTAGRLIEAAGLKGYRVGDAAVSIKHANFIVNQGAATAADVRAVIEHVRKTVKEHSGVDLEPEIVIAGEW